MFTTTTAEAMPRAAIRSNPPSSSVPVFSKTSLNSCAEILFASMNANGQMMTPTIAITHSSCPHRTTDNSKLAIAKTESTNETRMRRILPRVIFAIYPVSLSKVRSCSLEANST